MHSITKCCQQLCSIRCFIFTSYKPLLDASPPWRAALFSPITSRRDNCKLPTSKIQIMPINEHFAKYQHLAVFGYGCLNKSRIVLFLFLFLIPFFYSYFAQQTCLQISEGEEGKKIT